MDTAPLGIWDAWFSREPIPCATGWPAMQHRKLIRLPGFDYGQRGVYYVSIGTRLGRPLLGRRAGNQVVLSALGLLAQSLWRELPRHAPGVRMDVHVVMPTHIHGILVFTLPGSTGQHEAFGRPTRNSLPTLVRGFKAAVTREWRRISGRDDLCIWQSRYLERVVRSRQELASMRCFVRDNLLWHRLCDGDYW